MVLLPLAKLGGTCWVQTSVLSLASCLILGKFLMFFQPLVAVLANWLFLLFQTVP